MSDNPDKTVDDRKLIALDHSHGAPSSTPSFGRDETAEVGHSAETLRDYLVRRP